MRFYKNNAYPDIILHDYTFKPIYDGENLVFDFDQGFCVKVGEEYEHSVKGMIKIPKFSLDELNVYSVKYFNFLGIHRKIERYIEVDEFFELCKKTRLVVYEEYYAMGQFMWECALYPYDEKMHKKYGNIVINAYTGDLEKPLEYYLYE